VTRLAATFHRRLTGPSFLAPPAGRLLRPLAGLAFLRRRRELGIRSADAANSLPGALSLLRGPQSAAPATPAPTAAARSSAPAPVRPARAAATTPAAA